jgi:hypothetical protein
MTAKSQKSPATTAKKVVKRTSGKNTTRTSDGKKHEVTTKTVAPTKAPRKAPVAKKAAPAKAAKKAPVKPVPTTDAPLPSGWVRQSTVLPDADTAPSLFTTQTQRRLLRALATDGEITTGDVTSANVSDLPTATQRTVARLTELGYLTVAKSGLVKVTKSGHEFVTANPAPRVRSAKPAPAKKAPAKKAAPRKAPAKAAPAGKGTGRKVVRKAAKK